MRKAILVVAAALLTAACEPGNDDVRLDVETLEYSTPDTTAGDADGAAVDRSDDTRPDDVPPLNESERSRLDSWSGTGDAPFGDGPNDGRFRDVTCGVDTGEPANGYTGGIGCVYADGTYAARGITYANGVWRWGPVTLSTPGQCPDQTSCALSWSHATTSPVVVD